MTEMDRRTFLKIANTLLMGAATGCSTLVGNSKSSLKAPQTKLSFDEIFLKHSLQGHAENPYRVESAMQCLLGGQCSFGSRFDSVPNFKKIPMATFDELRLVHRPEYIETIKALKYPGSFLSSSRWAPYGGPLAYDCAATASGACIALFKDVVNGAAKNGFAVVRPPGHHAHAGRSDGYCLFNNIAVGIKNLQVISPARVAIVDFDVHHGDGLEDIFYSDPNVLYISTHQNDWPFTGKMERIGEGMGKGYNMNIPLPYGTGDLGFEQIFLDLIAPKVGKFKPDLIVVAAGYDSHWRDPQGSLGLSLTGLKKLSQNLVSLAEQTSNGRIAFVLEGGYFAPAVTQGILNSIDVLNGHFSAALDSIGPSPTKEPNISSLIQKVAQIQKI